MSEKLADNRDDLGYGTDGGRNGANKKGTLVGREKNISRAELYTHVQKIKWIDSSLLLYGKCKLQEQFDYRRL